MIDWLPIIEKGAIAIAPEVFKSAMAAASSGFKQLRPYASLNFDDHFLITFQRCTKIKTIVSGDAPIDLLKNYINLNFRHSNKNIDDYTLIDDIWENRRAVVSGPAGCGKSMFMRYLWISAFVQARGKIPIFIELRQLNNFENEDFTSFLFHSCAFKQQRDARPIFDRAIAEGQFIFIFDGFDELSPSRADFAEREILKLSDLSSNIVVVSGRKDDRFDAWHRFWTYWVEPLNKKQVTQLIKTIEFDNAVKRKFLSHLKSGLYDRHKDFISRPLLATMMLLTYNAFADVPDRVHVFYDQAFDTLFSRHDATKEAFKRKRHTDLSIDEFKKMLGYFCLLSYVDQKADFTETHVLEYIRKACSIGNNNINPDDFLRDLMNAVCVLQRDGLQISFSHRSFQEYFCAYAAIRLTRDQARILVGRIAERKGDSVIPMIFEMNRSFLEDVYIDPMVSVLNPFLDTINEKTKTLDLINFFRCKIYWQRFKDVKIINRSKLIANQIELVQSEDSTYFDLIQVVNGNDSFEFLDWFVRLYGGNKLASLMPTFRPRKEPEILGLLIPAVDEERETQLLMLSDPLSLSLYRYTENTDAEDVLDMNEFAQMFLDWLDRTIWANSWKSFLQACGKKMQEMNLKKRRQNDDMLTLLVAKPQQIEQTN